MCDLKVFGLSTGFALPIIFLPSFSGCFLWQLCSDLLTMSQMLVKTPLLVFCWWNLRFDCFFFSLFSSVLCNYFVRSHLYNKNLIVKLVKSYKWFCDEFKHSITKKICMTFKRSARISFYLMVLNYSGEAKKSPYQSKTSNWIHVFGGQ